MDPRWLLITHDYLPMKGGVARYLGDLVAASRGEIQVIVPSDHPMTPEPVERARFFMPGPIRWWPLLLLVWRERRRLGTNGQLLISHVLPIGTAAWLISQVTSVRYTLLFHGLDLRLAVRTSWKRWLARLIVRGAAHICVNSEYVAREVRQAFPGAEPLVLTPGCAPRELPSRNAARQALGLAESDIILLQVARLVPRKGLDRAIQSLNALPERVRLVSIGDGADRARLETLAAPFGKRVTFLGAVDDATRNQWYAAADVFVFPVRADGDDLEGYGITCLEAAAAGLPVIVGDQGGAPETVVPGETGLVVNADDCSALTGAIQHLVDDPVLRRVMGERGRARVVRDHRWSDRWAKFAALL